MKKLLLVLSAAVALPVQAAWVAVWADTRGGIVYYENATVQYSGPVSSGNQFLRAHMYTNYMNAINSNVVCYPSGSDCQWKRLNTLVTYDWDCRNTVRLEREVSEWDSGPTSESYDPQRPGYTIPEPKPLVAKPQPVKTGATYNIANDPSLMAVQAAVCRHWPR